MKIIQIQTGMILAPEGPREMLYGLDVTGKIYYGHWFLEEDGKGNKVNAFTWDGILPENR